MRIGPVRIVPGVTSTGLAGPPPADDADALRRELRRVGDRLRVVPARRLELGLAQEVHRVAQRLADMAADLEGQPRRPVPTLALHGLGDQLEVLGEDLLSASARRGQTGTGQGEGSLGEAQQLLTGLRRGL